MRSPLTLYEIEIKEKDVAIELVSIQFWLTALHIYTVAGPCHHAVTHHLTHIKCCLDHVTTSQHSLELSDFNQNNKVIHSLLVQFQSSSVPFKSLLGKGFGHSICQHIFPGAQ